MIHWIFDLDDTLYKMKGNTFDINNIERYPKLQDLLKLLPGNKLVFTNASHGHSMNMICNLNLFGCFSAILSRDILMGIKPNSNTYFKLIHICNIKPNDKVIFFEDTPVNLLTAKQYGWTTVLITRENDPNKDEYIKLPFIDRCYPDIITSIKDIINIS